MLFSPSLDCELESVRVWEFSGSDIMIFIDTEDNILESIEDLEEVYDFKYLSEISINDFFNRLKNIYNL